MSMLEEEENKFVSIKEKKKPEPKITAFDSAKNKRLENLKKAREAKKAKTERASAAKPKIVAKSKPVDVKRESVKSVKPKKGKAPKKVAVTSDLDIDLIKSKPSLTQDVEKGNQQQTPASDILPNENNRDNASHSQLLKTVKPSRTKAGVDPSQATIERLTKELQDVNVRLDQAMNSKANTFHFGVGSKNDGIVFV